MWFHTPGLISKHVFPLLRCVCKSLRGQGSCSLASCHGTQAASKNMGCLLACRSCTRP